MSMQYGDLSLKPSTKHTRLVMKPLSVYKDNIFLHHKNNFYLKMKIVKR